MGQNKECVQDVESENDHPQGDEFSSLCERRGYLNLSI